MVEHGGMTRIVGEVAGVGCCLDDPGQHLLRLIAVVDLDQAGNKGRHTRAADAERDVAGPHELLDLRPGAIEADRWWPASVNRTPRVLRSNRRTPRSSSKALIRALTLDWVTPSAKAACRKLRYSATASAWHREASEILALRRYFAPDFPDFRMVLRFIEADDSKT